MLKKTSSKFIYARIPWCKSWWISTNAEVCMVQGSDLGGRYSLI